MTGTPEPDEPASTVLRVGYYYKNSDPITDAELAAVKAAFEAANEGITIEWAEYKYSTSSFTINDMIKDINAKNSDADETNNIDCLVNFGKMPRRRPKRDRSRPCVTSTTCRWERAMCFS